MMLKLKQYNISRNIRINELTGELEVQDVLEQTVPGMDWFPFRPPYVNVDGLCQSIGPFCKIYALADALKRTAIDVLGLEEDKVYGTDSDKQEVTHLLWEDMPGVTDDGSVDLDTMAKLGMTYHIPGNMTIREVLQYMGTEVFRKMYDTVWVDTLLRRIKREQPEVALICDVRFENETSILKEAGATILGLDRDIFESKDTHASEQINFDLCDVVIKNHSMNIEEQCASIYQAISRLRCENIPRLIVSQEPS